MPVRKRMQYYDKTLSRLPVPRLALTPTSVHANPTTYEDYDEDDSEGEDEVRILHVVMPMLLETDFTNHKSFLARGRYANAMQQRDGVSIMTPSLWTCFHPEKSAC